MDHADPVSLWDAMSQEPRISGDFTPGDTVDVAIIGGGYTGLSAALHCAETGLSAHLLEAREIGHGGSGRNAGLVNAAAWLPPAKVRDVLGADYGARFLGYFGNGPRVVFDLIEKHQIRCDARQSGTIHAAHAPSGFRDLQARHAEWQRLGEPVDLIGRDDLSDLVGSRAFFGGLLDHRAGTINPMGYCRGLARAAVAAGAKVSTNAPARAIDRVDGTWRVTTDVGEVGARNVILATNAYTDTLWPGLDRVFSTIDYLQIATAPLGPEADHILPEGRGLWDTGTIMFSCRRDAENRLVLGTMGRVIGSVEAGVTRRWAARQIARLFPELRHVAFVDAWHGKIAMTPDHLPKIHQLAPGVWTAIGYNGRGIATGTLFGQTMAELLTGADPARLPLPVSEPRRVPLAGVVSKAHDLAFTANQIWKGMT